MFPAALDTLDQDQFRVRGLEPHGEERRVFGRVVPLLRLVHPTGQRSSVTASPASAQAPITGMIPALKRNSAAKAPMPMIAESHSKAPAKPLGQSTCQAKNSARFTITPTTAAVMPVSGALNFRLPCVVSTKGAPMKMKMNEGRNVKYVAVSAPAVAAPT